MINFLSCGHHSRYITPSSLDQPMLNNDKFSKIPFPAMTLNLIMLCLRKQLILGKTFLRIQTFYKIYANILIRSSLVPSLLKLDFLSYPMMTEVAFVFRRSVIHVDSYTCLRSSWFVERSGLFRLKLLMKSETYCNM